MRRKAVGPVCCVMHVKEPRTLIMKEQGLASVFLDMCALQIFCIVIIMNTGYFFPWWLLVFFQEIFGQREICKQNYSHVLFLFKEYNNYLF